MQFHSKLHLGAISHQHWGRFFQGPRWLPSFLQGAPSHQLQVPFESCPRLPRGPGALETKTQLARKLFESAHLCRAFFRQQCTFSVWPSHPSKWVNGLPRQCRIQQAQHRNGDVPEVGLWANSGHPTKLLLLSFSQCLHHHNTAPRVWALKCLCQLILKLSTKEFMKFHTVWLSNWHTLVAIAAWIPSNTSHTLVPLQPFLGFLVKRPMICQSDHCQSQGPPRSIGLFRQRQELCHQISQRCRKPRRATHRAKERIEEFLIAPVTVDIPRLAVATLQSSYPTLAFTHECFSASQGQP